MKGRRLRLWICSLLALAGAAIAIAPALGQAPSAGRSSGIAYSIQLQATIDPATEKWISSALDNAASEHARIAIIRLDTPGGLADSMRSIIQDMFAAPMPVVVYVSPDGARAGSAGAYITQAADVAAMAPVTNIGSATPIAIGPGGESQDLARKIKNDAAASMRAFADEHGRNPKLAQLLVILVNPNVSYLLILLGLVGLGIELVNPGLIAPGTIGLISFLLGLYGTAQLPVTIAGVLLLSFGIAMIIAEAHLPTHGILGASGVASLIASGLLLYDTNTSAFEISPVVVIIVGLILGGALAFAVERAVRARRQPKRTGWEEMTGAIGEVREPLDPVGQVFVQGALWRAQPVGTNRQPP